MGKHYSDETLIEALNVTQGLISLAAKRVGCSPQTIYTRIKESEAVAATVKDKREELVDSAELALRNAVLNGESWAVGFTLKCLGKDRGYVERQELAHSGSLEVKRDIRLLMQMAGRQSDGDGDGGGEFERRSSLPTEYLE